MFGGGTNFLFPFQVKWMRLSRGFFLGGGAYQLELNLPFQESPTDPKLMAQGRSSPQRSVTEN